MSIISIIGPKGGIGKTTLSINITAAITRQIPVKPTKDQVCLIDLDLRLPTISSLLNSHPTKTFYDLFEILANKIYQLDFLREIYQIITVFKYYLARRINSTDPRLEKALALYKNLNTDLFRFSDFKYSEHVYELFLYRGEIKSPSHLNKLRPLLRRIDLREFVEILKQHDRNSYISMDEFVSYIEEYQFSIIGGEIPIMGKKVHRKRINEPEYLLLLLDFLCDVFHKFEHVILDTPAGGINHLPSLMNFIDQIIFLFDLSNNIAVNGSIDALHTFIDYCEEFYDDYQKDKLTGIDKVYINKLISTRGVESVVETMKNKSMGIVFNRFQDEKEIVFSLDRLRDYLDTLNKYETYKERIKIIGMLPQHKIINITNNLGALFYEKDKNLTQNLDLISANIITANRDSPTLACDNNKIVDYLLDKRSVNFQKKFINIADNLKLKVLDGLGKRIYS